MFPDPQEQIIVLRHATRIVASFLIGMVWFLILPLKFQWIAFAISILLGVLTYVLLYKLVAKRFWHRKHSSEI